MVDARRFLHGAADGPPQSLDERRTFDVGQIYGRYHVVAALQRGGMGEIVVAEDLESDPPGQHVVLKRLLEEFVEDDEFLEMFGSEARITSRLVHPNIVRIVDTPVIDGAMCLALEFVPGRNVLQINRAERARGSRIPPNIAVHIMEKALRGLHHAHSAVDELGRPLEIVHRDVSPGNILVAFDGAVKITDFGIAKSTLSVASTADDLLRGTTRYLTPERINGGPLSPRSDLFSSASVLAELLTGEPLFDGGTVPPTLMAIVKGQHPPLSEILPVQIPILTKVMEASLSVSVEDRPSSAAEFADALAVSQRELGGSPTEEQLGHYLRELFGEGAVPPESVSVQARYLIEIGEPLAMGEDGEPAPGERPLNAAEFAFAPVEEIEALLSDSASGARLVEEKTVKAEPVRVAPRERETADLPRNSSPGREETAPPRERLPPSWSSSTSGSTGSIEADAFASSQDLSTPSERSSVEAVLKPVRRWRWFVSGFVLGAIVMFAALEVWPEIRTAFSVERQRVVPWK